ncbi:MAG: hypothetical protein IPN95_17150 [Bacteroidetes bacterium]|nr:hypothetical protein [Bacteroidota bacterium]
MYLQENTDAAKAMRRNIARLLRSDSGANRDLAFEMIKAGGMPLEVLIDVYHLYLQTWGQSSSLSNERAGSLPTTCSAKHSLTASSKPSNGIWRDLIYPMDEGILSFVEMTFLTC